MTEDKVINEYFQWLYETGAKRKNVRKLFQYLHERDFYYSIATDGNRAEDGVELRYHFGDEKGYPSAMIASCLDNRSCSVLEMMIALALRCEEHIMDDPTIGNRTTDWVQTMLSSLGIVRMTDKNFNKFTVEECVSVWLERQHEKDGRGGLFLVKNCSTDLRGVDIWYQMCIYLNSIL